MNVNKDGQPETRVDKQSIFKDYGMYDFNKVNRQDLIHLTHKFCTSCNYEY